MQGNTITEKPAVETIILSDIHLGSDVARPSKARETLKKYNFKRLILLGDIFEDLNFNRLKKEHWGFLSYVRKLSNPNKQIEVIWVEGNHDEGLSKITSHFLGLKILKQYMWRCSNKTILAIHGHQFDRFLIENALLSKIASYFYLLIQRVGGKNQRIARWLKTSSKGWLRISQKIAVGASSYARRRKADAVICGHTHIAMEQYYQNKKVHYYNSGCWTDIPSSYITVSENGDIKIEYCN